MLSTSSNQATFIGCLHATNTDSAPYDHWILENPLDDEVIEALLDLPFEVPKVDCSDGRREAYNSTRRFFDPAVLDEFEVCKMVAETMQSQETVSVIQDTCGVDLKGSSLRIEYVMDRDEFWLEPHTDIGAKRFTMLIYLSPDPESDTWGTDIYEGPGPETYLATVPFKSNRGLIFLPGEDTWHGFRKRPINGIRRALIVNYVSDDWRARHELCFPESRIG